MLNLQMIFDTIRMRHTAKSFEVGEDDPIRVFPQEVWHDMSPEERLGHFAEKNILLVHDRASGRPHPFPIMKDIKKWDENQIARYFDIFGHRFMHEQSWCPKHEFAELRPKPGASSKNKKSVSPRKTLRRKGATEIDDGRFAASKSWFKGSLPKPTRPESVEVAAVDSEKHPELTEVSDAWPTPDWLNGDGHEIDESITADQLSANANLRLRAAEIEQFMFQRTRRSRFHDGQLIPAVVNFLDLPMSGCPSFGIPIEGLDPFPNLQDHHLPDYTFATQVPHEDFRWGLIASGGAITDTHMDAGGFATIVRLLLGLKLWFIGYPDIDDPMYAVCDSEKEEIFWSAVDAKGKGTGVTAGQFPKTEEQRWKRPLHKRTSSGGRFARAFISLSDGFQDRALKWFMVVLKPGDDL